MMTRQVEVIGHRGARGLFPENTIDGFRRAWNIGVRWFELDVGMTADGAVVVSHDLALNPDITRDAAGHFLTGPTPLIHALTLDVLGDYDVGRIRPASRYRLSHRAQKPGDGSRIPTLEQALRATPDARFIIELKTDPRHPDWTASPVALADAVLAVIDAAGAAAQVILESFDWRGPRHIGRVRPEIKTAWLTREETVRDAALWWDGETPAHYGGSVPATVAAQRARGGGLGDGQTYWAPAFDTLTQDLVAKAHERGLRVIPWTVNRRAAMRRLIRWGVDGLITDRPDVALKMTAGGITAGHSA
jgi:glycerophosphoryl diester phosphodiesterase